MPQTPHVYDMLGAVTGTPVLAQFSSHPEVLDKPIVRSHDGV